MKKSETEKKSRVASGSAYFFVDRTLFRISALFRFFLGAFVDLTLLFLFTHIAKIFMKMFIDSLSQLEDNAGLSSRAKQICSRIFH